jgi:tripartite-type tricarboxylate transporter receptor subunit TctC
VGWFALAGPAGMPRDIVEKLEAAAATVLAEPDVKKTFVGLGLDISPMTSVPLANLIKEDLVRYTDIKNRARITIE